MAVLALPIVTYPLGRDQGEFATIGAGILNGRIPYTDLWNPKPPAVFYVYSTAIALFGHTAPAIRSIDLFIFPLIGAGLYWLSARLTNRRAALLTVAGFGAFYFTEGFWTLTQNDGIAILPMLGAVICALQAAEKRHHRRSWVLLTGAMCALTLWFKYPFILLAIALAFNHTFYCLRAGKLRRLILDTGIFITGALVVGFGGLLYLHTQGALSAFIESARVTSSYTQQGYDLKTFFTSVIWRQALQDRWAQWSPLVILCLLWPIAWWAARPRSAQLVHRQRAVWLWGIAGLGMMLTQAKGYDYHWLPVLPPMLLIAADSFARLTAKIHVPRDLQRALYSITLVGLLASMFIRIWIPTLPYILGETSRIDYYDSFRGGEFVASESEVVITYLRERVSPGDSLFIWGFRPEVYFLSRLNPAIRFIFQFPLVADWYPKAWRQEAVDVLWAAMPPYVLVLQGDFMPWVTGKDDDSHGLLFEYIELQNWLLFNYMRETEIGGFIVWRRKA